MIVSCPECRTLFRLRAGSRRSARCGACHAEVLIPSARTYRIRTVGEATLRRLAPAPAPILAAAGGASEARATAWVRPDRPVRSAAASEWPVPEMRSWERLDDGEPAGASPVDRRLDEIARRVEEASAIEDSTLRNVVLGVGIGAVAGVAFAPGLFDAAWVSWAVGGAMGGVAAALWSRAWGLRRA